MPRIQTLLTLLMIRWYVGKDISVQATMSFFFLVLFSSTLISFFIALFLSCYCVALLLLCDLLIIFHFRGKIVNVPIWIYWTWNYKYIIKIDVFAEKGTILGFFSDFSFGFGQWQWQCSIHQVLCSRILRHTSLFHTFVIFLNLKILFPGYLGNEQGLWLTISGATSIKQIIIIDNNVRACQICPVPSFIKHANFITLLREKAIHLNNFSLDWNQ